MCDFLSEDNKERRIWIFNPANHQAHCSLTKISQAKVNMEGLPNSGWLKAKWLPIKDMVLSFSRLNWFIGFIVLWMPLLKWAAAEQQAAQSKNAGDALQVVSWISFY